MVERFITLSYKTQLKPPLKWLGGKRWLVPVLRELWEPYATYRLVEPFVGGMAVALGLDPDRALLNDANRHLINFYRWLQRGLVVETRLQQDKTIYYQYRNKFNELISNQKAMTQEAAELFYYLNRTGYNGLCRFNKSGGYNVPFGRHKTVRYVPDLRPYAALVGNWQFTGLDFEHLSLCADDFVYADPPYDVSYNSYHDSMFSWQDQVRLAHWLADHRGPVVVSNRATDRICELYQGLGFHLRILPGPRRISCTGDRRPVMEVLASKQL